MVATIFGLREADVAPYWNMSYNRWVVSLPAKILRPLCSTRVPRASHLVMARVALCYNGGQVDYIQTLYGDREMP